MGDRSEERKRKVERERERGRERVREKRGEDEKEEEGAGVDPSRTGLLPDSLLMEIATSCARKERTTKRREKKLIHSQCHFHKHLSL